MDTVDRFRGADTGWLGGARRGGTDCGVIFNAGLRLAGRYRLVERIGSGGMSEVWRAEDELLGRPVAVKALAAPLAADPALRASTWQEARSVARITHPHVTHVYDYGEVGAVGGGSVPYLVMELINGQDLADRLRRGPLPWSEAALTVGQVAAALAAAHRLGIVHRDVKPGNVMLTASGAKVLDFGIAALAGASPEAEAGWLIGTPAYTAPERLRPGGGVHPAADIYSLGALFHVVLTGRPPIPVSNWDDAMAAHARAQPVEPPRASGLPADLAALCMSCLSRDPAARPTADQVAVRLGAATGGTGTPDIPRPAAPAVSTPTLVDRSLVAGTVRGGPPATGGRIAASAVVPPRPADSAPGPGHWAAAGGRLTPTGQPLLSRSTAILVVGAILMVGLVIVFTLVVGSDSETDTVAPGGTATSDVETSTEPSVVDSVEPPATTSSPIGPRSNDPAEIVTELDRLLAEAVGTGEVRGKAVKELTDGLDALRDKVENGKRKEIRDKARDLQKKIRDGMEKGTVDSAAGSRLLTVLGPLLGERDEDEDEDG